MTIFIARDMSDRESNVMLLILSVQNDNILYKSTTMTVIVY